MFLINTYNGDPLSVISCIEQKKTLWKETVSLNAGKINYVSYCQKSPKTNHAVWTTHKFGIMKM